MPPIPALPPGRLTGQASRWILDRQATSFAPFAHPTFLRLFAALAVALTGTGLATVALGLLADDLAGENAGADLGTALAIKMVAHVTLAPLASALAARLPRLAFPAAPSLPRWT